MCDWVNGQDGEARSTLRGGRIGYEQIIKNVVGRIFELDGIAVFQYDVGILCDGRLGYDDIYRNSVG